MRQTRLGPASAHFLSSFYEAPRFSAFGVKRERPRNFMTHLNRIRSVLGVALAAPILLGCATTPPARPSRPAPTPEDHPDHADLLRQADRQFAQAVLLKPKPTLSEETPAARFAPLLLLESERENPTADLPEGPVIFFTEGAALLKGQWHPQMTYAWRLGFARADPNHPGPWQGLRLTFNEAGEPVIWEIFRHPSRARVIFVARSLEAAAWRDHGPPLPGRLHAIERSRDETPDVLVVRVIEDGPVPMGPIAHVDVARGEITSIICRCMPSQVGQLAGQGEYELLPFEANPEIPVPEADFDPGDLGRELRLPASF